MGDISDDSVITKRRRLDGHDPQSASESSFGWGRPVAVQAQPQPQSQPPPHSYQHPSGTDSRSAFGMQGDGGGGDMSNQNARQYYSTDPITYLSSWPPVSTALVPSAEDNRLSFGQQQQTGDGNYLSAMQVYPPNSLDPIDMNQRLEGFASHLPLVRHQSMAPPQESPGFAVRQLNTALHYDDGSMHLKLQSLSIMENLATRLIHTVAGSSFSQLQQLMHTSDSEESQAFATLKNLFDQTRKVYCRETPFIDSIAVQMFQPSQQEIIRKANIATFICSILGSHDVSFYHLNEHFLETFVPFGHRLLKWQGAMFLELKTQTYISALMNSDGNPQALLDELFPSDLDAQIITRHPDAPSLSPSEQDLIDRCNSRKSYLLQGPSTQDEVVGELSRRYHWNDFAREFGIAISKNADSILNIPARTHQMFNSGGGPDKRMGGAVQAPPEAAASPNPAPAAQQQAQHGLAVLPANTIVPSERNPNALLQTGSNSLENPKRTAPSTSAIRQPWSKAEEEVLLQGLQRVNGPHWSQILALYGRGGSVSEVLKDRNQVQLKDKARNLKLWYLKTGKEVPDSLKGVTGELKKRGGARAKAALGLVDNDEDEGAASCEADNPAAIQAAAASSSSAAPKRGRKSQKQR